MSPHLRSSSKRAPQRSEHCVILSGSDWSSVHPKQLERYSTADGGYGRPLGDMDMCIAHLDLLRVAFCCAPLEASDF